MCLGTRCTHHFNPAIEELEKDYDWSMVMVHHLGDICRARDSFKPENYNSTFIQPLFQIKDDADCEEDHAENTCAWQEQPTYVQEQTRRLTGAIFHAKAVGIPIEEVAPFDESWKVTRL